MDKEKTEVLAAKRLHLQKQLQAKDYIERGIRFHWLDYYEQVSSLGICCNIKWLCDATPDEQPYFAEAIRAFDHADLKPELINVTDESLLNKICNEFPSVSPFKYVMDLPILQTQGSTAGEALLKAQQQLQITDGPVYFLSTDCCPLLQLQWSELVQHADTIFDDSIISLIFTDPGYTWIIFRSIEDEWHCGFTNTKK